jgi:hypothetical protein
MKIFLKNSQNYANRWLHVQHLNRLSTADNGLSMKFACSVSGGTLNGL